MNFENHIPIYIQIIDIIKRDIVLGICKPGEKLQSVRDYALELKVNPNTVQKAYQEMERMNLAYTKRGIGRFIVEDEAIVLKLKHEMSDDVVYVFIEKMKELGYTSDEIMSSVKERLNGGKK